MAMNDAPAILLAPENPGRADLKYRLLSLTRDVEAHFLTLYDIAEILVHARRNSLDCQGSVAVLRIRPVESWPDLFPTVFTTPARNAKERDVGVASPERLKRFRMASK